MPKDQSLKQYVLFTALMAGIAVFIYWQSNVKEEEQVQAVRTDLSRMTLAQAISHCRTLWKAWHFDQAPLAIAWHSQGLDWYVIDGTDAATMRNFSCDGNDVTGGKRFERVMKARIPAPGSEAAKTPLNRNLFDHYTALPDAGWRALEATEDPATHALVERRWTRTGAVEFDWPQPKDLPILFRQRPADLAIEPFPLLKAIETAGPWIRRPADVFAMLEKKLPPRARIAELDIFDTSFKVTLAGSFRNNDGKPPAPFGAMNFDEYGVAGSDEYYPYDQAGSSCAPGHTLGEVASLFAQSANASNPAVYAASFNCRAGAAPTARGVWTLHMPKRRR